MPDLFITLWKQYKSKPSSELVPWMNFLVSCETFKVLAISQPFSDQFKVCHQVYDLCKRGLQEYKSNVSLSFFDGNRVICLTDTNGGYCSVLYCDYSDDENSRDVALQLAVVNGVAEIENQDHPLQYVRFSIEKRMWEPFLKSRLGWLKQKMAILKILIVVEKALRCGGRDDEVRTDAVMTVILGYFWDRLSELEHA
jgi:hypothetical protein